MNEQDLTPIERMRLEKKLNDELWERRWKEARESRYEVLQVGKRTYAIIVRNPSCGTLSFAPEEAEEAIPYNGYQMVEGLERLNWREATRHLRRLKLQEREELRKEGENWLADTVEAQEKARQRVY